MRQSSLLATRIGKPINARLRPIADTATARHHARVSRFRLSLCIVLSTLLAPAAHACSIIVQRQPSPAEKLTEAARLVRGATAVIDGEVVRPLSANEPALVRAYRVLKGPAKQFFEVGTRSTCDIALDRSGERLRLILVGGPDLYFLPVDYSNARYEDRVLRSDRKRVWPYRQGG